MDIIIQYTPLLLSLFSAVIAVEVIVLRYRKDDKLSYNLALIFSIVLLLWILSDNFVFFTYNENIKIFFDAIGKAIAIFIVPMVFLFLICLFKNKKCLSKYIAVILFPPLVLAILYIISAITDGSVLNKDSYLEAKSILIFPFLLEIIIYSILIIFISIVCRGEKVWKNIKCKELILLAFSGIVPAFFIGVREYHQIFNFKIYEGLIAYLPYLGIVESSYLLIYLATRSEFADHKITKGFTTDKIIDSVDEYILAVDEKNIIALMNKSLLDKLEYNENEVINHNMMKIIDVFEKYIENMSYINDKFFNCEGEIISKSEKKYRVSIRISNILDKDSTLIGYIFIMRNMEELIDLQKSIKENKKELVNKKEEFKVISRITKNREKKLKELKEEYKKLLK